MRVGSSNDGQTIHEFRVIPTPQNFDEGMEKLIQLSNEVKNGFNYEKCAGGITGVLNREKNMLAKSPHLTDWVDKPIKRMLSDALQTEIFLENDSALVGLGEAVFGAGKGYRLVTYITISTGIGGVRIVDGKIDVNIYGFEPGHQIIDADGSIYPGFNPENTGDSKGEFESLASGFAIAKRWGKLPFDLNDEGAWEHIHWLIAQGLCNTILHWSPEIVVLGGGVSESGKLDLEKIKNHLRTVLTVFPDLPVIRKAELNDLSGLYGAIAYLSSLKNNASV